MHIADGILPVAACLAGHAAAWPAVYVCGRRVEPREASRMGLLAAAAFVSSLVHFPVAGTSIHLGLFGLLGVLLGRRAFPVVFSALLFQALLFQHGGLLTLGVNALNMGAGALAGWAVWRLPGVAEGARAFGAGFVGVMTPALLMAAEFSLAGYGKGFYFVAGLYALAAAVEGAATAAAVGFLRRTRPEVLAEALG
jgi:cobalt/nickel transport system permease protein